MKDEVKDSKESFKSRESEKSNFLAKKQAKQD
jgi:hypothetical protein